MLFICLVLFLRAVCSVGRDDPAACAGAHIPIRGEGKRRESTRCRHPGRRDGNDSSRGLTAIRTCEIPRRLSAFAITA